MEPMTKLNVANIAETDQKLTFTLSGVNVSIANGLRRIVSEIPTVVFRTSPHEANQAVFETNSTRMNNELLKQRLSCIPIYAPADFPINDYIMKVNKQNTSSTIQYVTTADFEVVDVKTNQKEEALTLKLFPANPMTGDYPELARLLPRVSETIEGEGLALTCKFDLGTAAEDSAFNVTSVCVYANTPDPIKIKAAWTEKKTELAKTSTAEEMAFAEKDWLLLDAKRHFLPDSFDFVIETVGPITNREIVTQAGQLMLNKLKKIQETIQGEPNSIAVSETTIPNSYDITLKGEDYTLGKVLEWMLYATHYGKTLNYCGFRKPHPHINESIIRLGFKSPTEPVTVASYIVNAAVEASRLYAVIVNTFETAK